MGNSLSMSLSVCHWACVVCHWACVVCCWACVVCCWACVVCCWVCVVCCWVCVWCHWCVTECVTKRVWCVIERVTACVCYGLQCLSVFCLYSRFSTSFVPTKFLLSTLTIPPYKRKNGTMVPTYSFPSCNRQVDGFSGMERMVNTTTSWISPSLVPACKCYGTFLSHRFQDSIHISLRSK